jgi:hypothetical protein
LPYIGSPDYFQLHEEIPVGLTLFITFWSRWRVPAYLTILKDSFHFQSAHEWMQAFNNSRDYRPSPSARGQLVIPFGAPANSLNIWNQW